METKIRSILSLLLISLLFIVPLETMNSQGHPNKQYAISQAYDKLFATGGNPISVDEAQRWYDVLKKATTPPQQFDFPVPSQLFGFSAPSSSFSSASSSFSSASSSFSSASSSQGQSFVSSTGQTIPFEDVKKKLDTLSYDPQQCVIVSLFTSTMNSFKNFKLLIDIEIERNIPKCRHELEDFIERFEPYVQESQIWVAFKSSVRDQVDTLDKSNLPIKDPNTLYRRAFDWVLNHLKENPALVRRGFQEYHGASRELSSKLKDELFGMFYPNNCRYVQYIEILLARKPHKYIGKNKAGRDVVDRLLAYCALKNYRG